MARLPFGGGSSDYTIFPPTSGGDLISVGATAVTMWSAATGGTHYTDLMKADGVTAQTSVTTNADGSLPIFYGPDSIAVMWADAGGTRRVKLFADQSVVIAAAIATQAAADSAAYSPIRRGRLGNSVVALGDSITAGVSGGNWVTTAALLSLGQIQVLHNAGVGGNTSAQMLARFSTDVAAYSPSVVMVLAGTNDTGQSVSLATFEANMQAIVADVYACGAIPVLMTMPPNLTGTPTNRQAAVVVFNHWIRRYARQNQIPLVDIYALVTDPVTGDYLSAYANDGTHPSLAGFAAIGQLVSSVVSPLLPPNSSTLPVDQTDPNNLMWNPLMLAQTATPGVRGDHWGAYGSGGTYTTDATDTTIKGDWQNFSIASGGPTGIQGTTKNTSYVPVAGHTYAICGLLKASGLGSGAVVSVNFISSKSGTVSIPVASYPSALIRGAFYQEVVLPAASYASGDYLAAIVVATGAATVGIAQMGIYDLTAMGLA